MEDNPNQPTTTKSPQVCINCGNPQIVHGFPNALCAECREKFIKFPIPLWVKLFGGGILALTVFLLVTEPKNLSTAIRYEKGVKAEAAKNYVTEQRLLLDVVKEKPGYIEAEAHLLIAAFYNHDLALAQQMSDKLLNQQFDDDALLNTVNRVIDESKFYVPGDSLLKYLQQYPDSAGGIPEPIYKKLISYDEGDIFTKHQYAAFLMNANRDVEADTVLTDILQRNASYIPALQLKMILLRRGKNAGDCIAYCDRLLAINAESVLALSCKARTYLRMGQPKEGMKYAVQALGIDPGDGYANATMVLAYHFNNMYKQRDALINKIKQGRDSLQNGYLDYPVNVINHKDSI